MGKKFLLVLAASLFAACLTIALILFLVEPTSEWFRLAAVATLVALLPLVLEALLSLRAYRRERRIASARLINEVRLHRAETKLMQADLDNIKKTLDAGDEHEAIRGEMRKFMAQLSDMSKQGERAVDQIADYAGIRTKQLVAILEAQRIELERLSMRYLK